MFASVAQFMPSCTKECALPIGPGPFVTPNYSFALRAPREEWDMFWRKVPPPGHNDIFALFKRGKLRIEGDLHPFMANLLYIKDVLAAPRKEAVQ